ncbi:MAG: hypothetical protein FRX49_12612 [Trebouxia sp. A1-2]|nr:MAG: hypothetical protein FRX49_12612 [Trebouxia sp. A1-2]
MTGILSEDKLIASRVASGWPAAGLILEDIPFTKDAAEWILLGKEKRQADNTWQRRRGKKAYKQAFTFASRSAVELIAAKVLSQLMPLRLTSPSLAASPCTVLPSPSPAERKLSVAIGEKRAAIRPLLVMRSPHTSMPRAFSVLSVDVYPTSHISLGKT